jgi:hypothetical protein
VTTKPGPSPEQDMLQSRFHETDFRSTVRQTGFNKALNWQITPSRYRTTARHQCALWLDQFFDHLPLSVGMFTTATSLMVSRAVA